MEEAEEDARSEAVEGVHLEDVLEEVVEVRVHLQRLPLPRIQRVWSSYILWTQLHVVFSYSLHYTASIDVDMGG